MEAWVIYVALSIIFTSVGIIIFKKVLAKERAFEFNVITKSFQAIFCIALIPFLNFHVDPWIVILAYGLSIGSVVALFFEARAFRHGELSLMAPLMNFSPAFTAILAIMFLGEQINLIQVSGIAIIVASSFFLESKHKLWDIKNHLLMFKSKYVEYLIASLIIISFTTIGWKFMMTNMATGGLTTTQAALMVTVFYFVFTAINFQLIHFLFMDGKKGLVHGLKTAGWGMAICGLLFVTGRILFMQAMALTLVSLVMPIRRLSTVIVTFVGGEIMHESKILQKTIVSLVMFLGAYLVLIG